MNWPKNAIQFLSNSSGEIAAIWAVEQWHGLSLALIVLIFIKLAEKGVGADKK